MRSRSMFENEGDVDSTIRLVVDAVVLNDDRSMFEEEKMESG